MLCFIFLGVRTRGQGCLKLSPRGGCVTSTFGRLHAPPKSCVPGAGHAKPPPLVSALHLGTNVGPDDMYPLSGRRTAYPQAVVAARYQAEPCQKGDPHVLATDHRPQPCSLPVNLQACKLVSFHRACPERVISKILTLMASVHPYKAALPLPSSSPSPPILEPSSDQTQPYQIIIRTPPRRRHEQPHILISSFAFEQVQVGSPPPPPTTTASLDTRA